MRIKSHQYFLLLATLAITTYRRARRMKNANAMPVIPTTPTYTGNAVYCASAVGASVSGTGISSTGIGVSHIRIHHPGGSSGLCPL